MLRRDGRNGRKLPAAVVKALGLPEEMAMIEASKDGNSSVPAAEPAPAAQTTE
jgi:hypothetical protein